MSAEVRSKIHNYCLKNKIRFDKISYGETRKINNMSITFSNGWVALIAENHMYPAKGSKYAIAIRNYYTGLFNFDILNEYGANDGCFYCNTDDEVINVCEIIRKLPNNEG